MSREEALDEDESMDLFISTGMSSYKAFRICIDEFNDALDSK